MSLLNRVAILLTEPDTFGDIENHLQCFLRLLEAMRPIVFSSLSSKNAHGLDDRELGVQGSQQHISV